MRPYSDSAGLFGPRKQRFQQFRTRLVDTLIVHIDGTEGTDNIDMAIGQSQRIEQHAAPAGLLQRTELLQQSAMRGLRIA